MRLAHDAAVRGGDGKNRKLQIVGNAPFRPLRDSLAL
jgi:hypothetical protein